MCFFLFPFGAHLGEWGGCPPAEQWASREIVQAGLCGREHLAHAENIGGGGNGYLFEVRQSMRILFRDCVAKKGRHNFIQNWGFGTTGCVWLQVESEDGVSGLDETFPLWADGVLGVSPLSGHCQPD